MKIAVFVKKLVECGALAAGPAVRPACRAVGAPAGRDLVEWYVGEGVRPIRKAAGVARRQAIASNNSAPARCELWRSRALGRRGARARFA